jgi:hypothetical protein
MLTAERELEAEERSQLKPRRRRQEEVDPED